MLDFGLTMHSSHCSLKEKLGEELVMGSDFLGKVILSLSANFWNCTRDGDPLEKALTTMVTTFTKYSGRGQQTDSEQKELKELIKKELCLGEVGSGPSPAPPRVPVLPGQLGEGREKKEGSTDATVRGSPARGGGPSEGTHVCLQDTLVLARTGWPKVGAGPQEDSGHLRANSRPSGEG